MTTPTMQPLHLSLFPSRMAQQTAAYAAVALTCVVLWWWRATWLVSILSLIQILLIWTGWWLWRHQQRQQEGSVSLDYQGNIHIQVGNLQRSATLSDGCLCADWGCRVVYVDQSGKGQSTWLYRDNMSEADYRRLCRVLNYHQRASTPTPQQPS